MRWTAFPLGQPLLARAKVSACLWAKRNMFCDGEGRRVHAGNAKSANALLQ
jgi:hypothetical protein